MRFTIAALLIASARPAKAENTIPTDAHDGCAISEATFRTWLNDPDDAASGIKPPNPYKSFNSECAFYQWGAQMFLWLTSPEGSGMVLNGDGFFNVVHDAKGTEKVAQVKVLPNSAGTPSVFAIRGKKGDENLPPAAFRGGVEQAGGGGVLLNQSGSLTYYGMHVNDTYVTFRNGFVDGLFVFEDGRQKGEDKKQYGNTHQFPTRRDDVDLVVAFGQDLGLIKGDPDVSTLAGTVELKTSWVASDSVDAADFLTITAQVPKFDKVSETEWMANGVETKTLAMVGMHIAAPVQGHPELVWISYEHLANSPMGSYVYNLKGGGTATHPYDSSGDWTFAQPNTPWPNDPDKYKDQRITPNASANKKGNIVGAKTKTGSRKKTKPIAPQNVVQFNPWGLAADSTEDLTNNTDLVALNASLIEILKKSGDPRQNYYQLGGVWTKDGVMPTYGNLKVVAGGVNLANSTMETFHQFGAQEPEPIPHSSKSFIPHNCLDCHSVAGASPKKPSDNYGVAVSHIFQGMRPFYPEAE